MKKLAFLTASVLMIAAAISGCGGGGTVSSTTDTTSSSSEVSATVDPVESTSQASSEEHPSANKDGKIIMATEATFPPYEYMEGNNVVGVDVDIANAIASEMGAELVIDPMDFNAVIEAVRTGKADMAISGISITEERQEQVDFSIEYATSDQVILTRADSGITNIEDLAGKYVGVQKGTTADLVLPTDYPDVMVEPYNRYTDAVLELVNGRIDAIVLDSLPAEALKNSNDGLVICEEVLFTDSYAIAVKKGNTELLNEINGVLQRLIDEGKIDEFTSAHLGA